jgi:general secretion pathway protein C
MLARLSAFAIWALVAATAVFWGLRLLVRAPSAPPYAVAVGDASAARGDLTRLLGAAPVNVPAPVVAPEASSRFRLLGIMAPKYSSGPVGAHGVALIAVDGKMPKAYPVGAHLDDDLVLQSVSLRTVSIGRGQGEPTITLELPPPAAAATGSLPVGPVGGQVSGPVVRPAAPTTPAAPQFNPAPVPQFAPQGPPPQPGPQPPMAPRADPGVSTQ